MVRVCKRLSLTQKRFQYLIILPKIKGQLDVQICHKPNSLKTQAFIPISLLMNQMFWNKSTLTLLFNPLKMPPKVAFYQDTNWLCPLQIVKMMILVIRLNNNVTQMKMPLQRLNCLDRNTLTLWWESLQMIRNGTVTYAYLLNLKTMTHSLNVICACLLCILRAIEEICIWMKICKMMSPGSVQNASSSLMQNINQISCKNPSKPCKSPTASYAPI